MMRTKEQILDALEEESKHGSDAFTAFVIACALAFIEVSVDVRDMLHRVAIANETRGAV